jgi:hypothetical protein
MFILFNSLQIARFQRLIVQHYPHPKHAMQLLLKFIGYSIFLSTTYQILWASPFVCSSKTYW